MIVTELTISDMPPSFLQCAMSRSLTCRNFYKIWPENQHNKKNVMIIGKEKSGTREKEPKYISHGTVLNEQSFLENESQDSVDPNVSTIQNI